MRTGGVLAPWGTLPASCVEDEARCWFDNRQGKSIVESAFHLSSLLLLVLGGLWAQAGLVQWARPMFCAPGVAARPGLGKGGGSRQREDHRGNIERGLEDLSAGRSLLVHTTPQAVCIILPSVAGFCLIQGGKSIALSFFSAVATEVVYGAVTSPSQTIEEDVHSTLHLISGFHSAQGGVAWKEKRISS